MPEDSYAELEKKYLAVCESLNQECKWNLEMQKQHDLDRATWRAHMAAAEKELEEYRALALDKIREIRRMNGLLSTV